MGRPRSAAAAAAADTRQSLQLRRRAQLHATMQRRRRRRRCARAGEHYNMICGWQGGGARGAKRPCPGTGQGAYSIGRRHSDRVDRKSHTSTSSLRGVACSAANPVSIRNAIPLHGRVV
eukprot:352726-Chlamydomonas_euryale.AAC.8